jgi:ADP-heptose:LPS heptosyltransferase
MNLRGLATVLAGADSVVVGNTGPAHLAAAVGTPVVEVFAPTVPADRWRPWGVPSVLLGQQSIGCAGCRSRSCPLPEQPCIADIGPEDVLTALDAVAPGRVTHQ